MITLEHISLSFGARRILHDVSFLINPHDRIGLVGSNGSGKSTMLRILSGDNLPDGGRVVQAKYVTVGYLPQDGMVAAGRTLYAEAELSFEDIITVERELDEARKALESLDSGSAEHADTLEVIGELQHKLEDLDAFRMKSKVEAVLMGLGFTPNDLERKTEEFSGGWQMRIALAKLLLKEPSLLLLDEPTNHLDIESQQWLEHYLRTYNGAIILVSHDRAFLDGLTTKTFALRSGTFEEYAGNYSFYEKEREIRAALLANAYKNQQDRIRHTEEFINRFRYKATKARQVQSRIKQLEKMERIELESGEKEIRFRFPQPPTSGRIVLELNGVSKRYGNRGVFDGLSLQIERGDRIAVVGPNGAGKSTLARILAGVETIDGGRRIPGHNVVVSYFAQHQAEELNPASEVLAVVEEVAEGEIRKNLRGLLGSFLFQGDDVFKRVSVLSGGEKSRLALAKMLLQPSNFMIMDEPTNHLDMTSKEILQEAIAGYVATFVIVSHDRAFLDPLVDMVVEVSMKGVKTHLGNVSDYIARKERQEQAARQPESFSSRPVAQKARRRAEAEARRRRTEVLKPLQSTLADVEKQIERAEARKEELETRLADPEFYKNSSETQGVLLEHREIEGTLSTLYRQWDAVTAQLEEAAKQFQQR